MAIPAIPKRAQDALKGLCCLARSSSPVRAAQVAECVGLSISEAARLLGLLAWGGFVESRRGAKGGFWLATPPDQLRIAEVISFFNSPRKQASNKGNGMQEALETALGPCVQTFERITLADLAFQTTPCGPENCSPR